MGILFVLLYIPQNKPNRLTNRHTFVNNLGRVHYRSLLLSCKSLASLLKPSCTHSVGRWVYAQSLSQKEMRIVKMTMAETKKKWYSSKCLRAENKKK